MEYSPRRLGPSLVYLWVLRGGAFRKQLAQEGFALVDRPTHGWIYLLVVLGGEELRGVLGVRSCEN